MMLALKRLSLYKELNVKIHPSWNNLFIIHVHSKTQYNLIDEDDQIKDNFEEEVDDVPIETMIHNFLDLEIINDYD